MKARCSPDPDASGMSGGSKEPMLEHDQTLAAMAEALARSGDYRVLRRLVPRTSFTPSMGPTKTAFDVETAGLDQRKDEVVELGMIKFDYLPDGRIASIGTSSRLSTSRSSRSRRTSSRSLESRTRWSRDTGSTKRPYQRSPTKRSLSSPATPVSSVSSPRATGRFFNERLGDVRPPRSSGENTASKAR